MPQLPPALETPLLSQRYRAGAPLGSGGMGSVFRAHDTLSGAEVAIKQLRRDALAQDASLLERFAREHEVLGRLQHPNIVRVLDAFADAGDQYLVMELVSGGSLDALLAAKSEPLSLEHVLRIALDLSDALTRVHRLDIVHRDIKPSNVLLAPDGTPRLSDFGLAQLGSSQSVTAPSAIVGTLDYLCPEALMGRRLDARADLWGLGAILFEMLTRRRPFGGEHVAAVLHAIASEPPLDLEALCPACPPELIDLIYRLLEKDPAQRVPSARQVGAELERIYQSLGTETGAEARTVYGSGTRDSKLPEDTDSLAQQDSVWNGLPTELTPFVGRDAEIRDIVQLLDNPQTRLLTIRGPGGMGKSRLAREVGRHLVFGAEAGNETAGNAARAGRHVEWVELAPLASADLIVAAIAGVVGVVFSPGNSEKDQLLRFLARRRLLLILDNFEHLLSGARLVSEIHAAAPGVQVLATSRESLGLTNEHIFELQGVSGTRLFLACASRVKPSFELTPERATAVTRICDLVSGMPLGLTLAAAWVNVLEPAEIADEIARSFEFLEVELRDLPERHHSVRAVFEHSWKLLSSEERRVFAALSVFRAGFTRAAAQAVTGASLRTLAALLNKSLVARDPADARYGMHELLRQYAASQLATNPAAEARALNEHSSYFTTLLASSYAQLKSASTAVACGSLESELDNLRFAWATAVKQLSLNQLSAGLEPLSLFYSLNGRFAEAASVFAASAQALTALRPARGSELARITALSLILEASAYHEQWQEPAAIAPTERALTLLDERTQPREVAFGLFILGIVRYWQAVSFGGSAVSLDAVEPALELYRATDDWWGTARALIILGQLVDPLRGEACFRESLTLQRSNGDGRVALSGSLAGLGTIKQERGDIDAARVLLLEALAAAEQCRDLSSRCLALDRLAVLELKCGKLETAEAYVLSWLSLCREFMPFAEHSCQIRLGEVLMAKGLISAAEQCFARATNTSGSELNSRCDSITVALAERGLGDTDARLGRYARATSRLVSSRAFFEQRQVPWGVVFAADSLGWAACLARDSAVAREQFQRVLQLAIEWRWWPWALGALAGQAWILSETGQAERAVQLAALVQAHPATEYLVRTERSAPLLSSLAERLPHHVFERALKRGQALKLAAALRWIARDPAEKLSAQGLRNLRTLLRNPS